MTQIFNCWIPCLIAALLLTSGCATTPAQRVEQIVSSDCPETSGSVESNLRRLATEIANAQASAHSRAESTHAMGCLLGSTRLKSHTFTSALLSVLSAGLLDFLEAQGREFVVPDNLQPAAVAALMSSYCDGNTERHEVARFWFRRYPHFFLMAIKDTPYLCKQPGSTSLAWDAHSVEDLRDIGYKVLDANQAKLDGTRREWSQFLQVTSTLESMKGQTPTADQALQALRSKLNTSLSLKTQTRDPAVLAESFSSALPEERNLPWIGPALAAVAPRMEARLNDPDPDLRVAAASWLFRYSNLNSVEKPLFLDKLALAVLREVAPGTNTTAECAEPSAQLELRLKEYTENQAGFSREFFRHKETIQKALKQLAKCGRHQSKTRSQLKAIQSFPVNIDSSVAFADPETNPEHSVQGLALAVEALLTRNAALAPKLQSLVDKSRDTAGIFTGTRWLAAALFSVSSPKMPPSEKVRSILGLESQSSSGDDLQKSWHEIAKAAVQDPRNWLGLFGALRSK